MTLIDNNIDKVRAFEIPAGIRADGSCAALPRLALVNWKSGWTDKLHQLYVNGRYAGTTVETNQRQLTIQIPDGDQEAVKIEVFAIEPAEADIDFSEQLDSSIAPAGQVKITFLRSQKLPLGATISVYSNNGSGEIDYDNPVNNSPISIWPYPQNKAGFGMSQYGQSDFGYDSSAAVGFGLGSFARGSFGIDADTFDWISEPLEAGVYRFAVKITDQTGNQSNAAETGPITVTPAAEPAKKLGISSFDKQTNQLLFSIVQ